MKIFNEFTALPTRNQPAPPSTSWRVGKSRKELSDAVKAEAARMSGSPESKHVRPITVGGRP